MLCGPEFFRFGFQRMVLAGLQFGDAPGVDVEADNRAFLAKFDSQGKADVTEADNGQLDLIQLHHDVFNREKPIPAGPKTLNFRT